MLALDEGINPVEGAGMEAALAALRADFGLYVLDDVAPALWLPEAVFQPHG